MAWCACAVDINEIVSASIPCFLHAYTCEMFNRAFCVFLAFRSERCSTSVNSQANTHNSAAYIQQIARTRTKSTPTLSNRMQTFVFRVHPLWLVMTRRLRRWLCAAPAYWVCAGASLCVHVLGCELRCADETACARPTRTSPSRATSVLQGARVCLHHIMFTCVQRVLLCDQTRSGLWWRSCIVRRVFKPEFRRFLLVSCRFLRVLCD